MAELSTTPLSQDANLISYLRFEGNSLDSKDSNNGTDTDITYGLSHGRYNQGGSFNGSSSIIDLGSPANLNISGNITLAAWINKNSLTGRDSIIGQYDSGGSVQQYGLNSDSDGKIYFTIHRSGDIEHNYGSTSTIVTGTWYHVAATQDGANVRIYINGNLDNAPALSAAPSASGFGNTVIGRSGSFNGNYYDGKIDEVAIFTRVLNAGEIMSLYSNYAVPILYGVNIGFNDILIPT